MLPTPPCRVLKLWPNYGLWMVTAFHSLWFLDRVRRPLQPRCKEERLAAPYSVGICFTMTPMLNQLPLSDAAQSFKDRDGDPNRLAGDFFAKVFGETGRAFVDHCGWRKPHPSTKSLICSDLRPSCCPLFFVLWPCPTPREQQFARHRESD